MRSLAFLVLGACATAPPPAPSPTPIVESSRDGIPVGSLAEAGFSPAAVAHLLDDARRTRTDVLLVLKDDKLVIEEYFGGSRGPVTVMSMSKSFANLAVGALVADGALALDQPASDFLTEWRDDPVKSTITIRQLLDHTSGLPRDRAKLRVESLRAHLAAPADSAPGAVWAYNNNAVDALGLVIELAAHDTLAHYLAVKLFEPIGASPGSYTRFADGAPGAAGELTIAPIALAKVGLLLTHHGVTDDGRSIVDPQWLTLSIRPATRFAPNCGLLWWRNVAIEEVGLTRDIFEYWGSHGLRAELLATAARFVDRRFTTGKAYRTALFAALGPAQRRELAQRMSSDHHFPMEHPLRTGPLHGFYAQGWLGQYLFVDPEARLVAVRLHRGVAGDRENDVSEFPEFLADIVALTLKP